MNDVSLKEYIEKQIAWLDRHFAEKIEWLDRHFDAQIKNIDSNTAKAKTEIDNRLMGMNEFRDSLRDQAARFATKEEVDLKLQPWNERIDALRLGKSFADGRQLVVSGIVALLSSVAVVVISHWLVK